MSKEIRKPGGAAAGSGPRRGRAPGPEEQKAWVRSGRENGRDAGGGAQPGRGASGLLKRLSRLLHIEHWQTITLIMMIYDFAAVNLSYALALWLRFDCSFSLIPPYYISAWIRFVPIYTVFCLAVFWGLKLYRSIWRFVSYAELYRTMIATLITAVFHLAGITLLFQRMPVSYYVMGPVIQFILTMGIRFSYRFLLLLRSRNAAADPVTPPKRVMLVGAGQAGQMILRDVTASRELNEQVVCIIDDNYNKWNRYIDGIPIVGGCSSIPVNAVKYNIDSIYIAIPSVSTARKREIMNICNETGCELKMLPGIYQLVNGQVTVSSLKEVSVEDLLGREPIRADLTEVREYIRGRTVLVTGGGGSIGSELSRQIAGYGPSRLIIFDIYENSTYSVQLELREKYPGLRLDVIIGSVRDSRKIFDVFEKYRPDVVFHAAAHKHVPLMEDSPCEAVKNNAIGTYKTAYAAMTHGCSRFVLISTDKAVNPTNVMGATKRLCEMIIQSFDEMIREGRAGEIPQLFTHPVARKLERSPEFWRSVSTEFVAVRFGNVLDSNGSVVPIFRQQIEKGGPVTVTHPDIIRYFMTIPEAVSLVLLAGADAKGGEIFVLDMGSPVKIDTLARTMIRLMGLKPDVDIKIEYTGLRPGEKLYEEKLMSEEGVRKTKNELIFIGNPIPFVTEEFLGSLEALMQAAYSNKENIRDMLVEMVPTYHPYGGAG